MDYLEPQSTRDERETGEKLSLEGKEKERHCIAKKKTSKRKSNYACAIEQTRVYRSKKEEWPSTRLLKRKRSDSFSIDGESIPDVRVKKQKIQKERLQKIFSCQRPLKPTAPVDIGIKKVGEGDGRLFKVQELLPDLCEYESNTESEIVGKLQLKTETDEAAFSVGRNCIIPDGTNCVKPSLTTVPESLIPFEIEGCRCLDKPIKKQRRGSEFDLLPIYKAEPEEEIFGGSWRPSERICSPSISQYWGRKPSSFDPGGCSSHIQDGTGWIRSLSISLRMLDMAGRRQAGIDVLCWKVARFLFSGSPLTFFARRFLLPVFRWPPWYGGVFDEKGRSAWRLLELRFGVVQSPRSCTVFWRVVLQLQAGLEESTLDLIGGSSDQGGIGFSGNFVKLCAPENRKRRITRNRKKFEKVVWAMWFLPVVLGKGGYTWRYNTDNNFYWTRGKPIYLKHERPLQFSGLCKPMEKLDKRIFYMVRKMDFGSCIEKALVWLLAQYCGHTNTRKRLETCRMLTIFGDASGGVKVEACERLTTVPRFTLRLRADVISLTTTCCIKKLGDPDRLSSVRDLKKDEKEKLEVFANRSCGAINPSSSTLEVTGHDWICKNGPIKLKTSGFDIDHLDSYPTQGHGVAKTLLYCRWKGTKGSDHLYSNWEKDYLKRELMSKQRSNIISETDLNYETKHKKLLVAGKVYNRMLAKVCLSNSRLKGYFLLVSGQPPGNRGGRVKKKRRNRLEKQQTLQNTYKVKEILSSPGDILVIP